MTEIVFLLEEESAQAMLEGLLPKLLPDTVWRRFIPFEGKQDLEKQLARKIRGYANRQARFVVIRDQDSYVDCVAVKKRLLDLCRKGGRPGALIRIACRELESFYVADLRAVEKGLNLRNLSKHQQTRKFRDPDHLHSPSAELKALTRGVYQKVSGSRCIGPHLDPNNRRSRSFHNLVEGIRRIAAGINET
jgi:hypothetical protein